MFNVLQTVLNGSSLERIVKRCHDQLGLVEHDVEALLDRRNLGTVNLDRIRLLIDQNAKFDNCLVVESYPFLLLLYVAEVIEGSLA